MRNEERKTERKSKSLRLDPRQTFLLSRLSFLVFQSAVIYNKRRVRQRTNLRAKWTMSLILMSGKRSSWTGYGREKEKIWLFFSSKNFFSFPSFLVRILHVETRRNLLNRLRSSLINKLIIGFESKYVYSFA